MQNVQALVFFCAACVLLVAVAAALSYRQAKKSRENLAVLARELGLRLEEKPPGVGNFLHVPTVSGPYHRRGLRFYSFDTGSGKQRQVWHAMSLTCANPHGFMFQLVPQNFVTSALAQMTGMKDVLLGDSVFDQRFLIRTSDPAFLCAALLPELRAALLGSWHERGFGGVLKLEGSEIVYMEHASFGDAELIARMRAMLAPLEALAALPEAYRR